MKDTLGKHQKQYLRICESTSHHLPHSSTHRTKVMQHGQIGVCFFYGIQNFFACLCMAIMEHSISKKKQVQIT
jgi:hypothetical protein